MIAKMIAKKILLALLLIIGINLCIMSQIDEHTGEASFLLACIGGILLGIYVGVGK